MNAATGIKAVKLTMGDYVNRVSRLPVVDRVSGAVQSCLVEIIFIIAFILFTVSPMGAGVWVAWWDDEIPMIEIYRRFRHQAEIVL